MRCACVRLLDDLDDPVHYVPRSSKMRILEDWVESAYQISWMTTRT